MCTTDYEPGKPDVRHSLFLSSLEMCKDVSFVGSTLKLYQEKNVQSINIFT